MDAKALVSRDHRGGFVEEERPGPDGQVFAVQVPGEGHYDTVIDYGSYRLVRAVVYRPYGGVDEDVELRVLVVGQRSPQPQLPQAVEVDARRGHDGHCQQHAYNDRSEQPPMR